MADHIDKGISGEKLAVQHLKEKGYHILHTNWRNGKAEADVIAENETFLVLVEVKTRATEYFGAPDEAVHKQKQKMLVKAAEAYIELNNINKEIRYDIISIVMNDKQTTINHIEDAFYPFASELDDEN
jgi:putative endonuclease